MQYQFYWPNWWKIWPSTTYVEYNEDGHYGPKKFGVQYICIGPLQMKYWRDL